MARPSTRHIEPLTAATTANTYTKTGVAVVTANILGPDADVYSKTGRGEAG